MKILVIGATGPLGRAVVEKALAQKHDVTALARKPTAWTNPPTGAKVIAGDVMAPETLSPAVSQAEVVISVLGTKLSRQPTTMLSEGTRHVISAMKQHGVKRLICVTGIGAGDSRGHGGWVYDHVVQPFLLKEIYLDKTRQEEIVKASGLDWIIVRPAQLTNGPATGKFQTYTSMTGVTAGKISRDDVASFLLDQVSSNQYLGKTPLISY